MTRKVTVSPASTYKFEHKKLFAMLKPDIIELLRENRAIIAGGAITSLFTNNEINDFDIYFRSQREMEGFLLDMFNLGVEFDDKGNFEVIQSHGGSLDTHVYPMGYTDKSVMFTAFQGHLLQVIAFDTFINPGQIFDKFDFSINMGAFDFSDDTWVFDINFLKDNSQRSLAFNPKTAFPLISMLRVGKYQGRGYRISKKDMMKIGVAVSKLSIENWSDAKKHLSGMYGTNVDALFKDAGDFTEDGLYDILENADHSYIETISTDSNLPPVPPEDVNWFTCIQNLRINTGADNIVTKAFGVCRAKYFGILDPNKPLTLGTIVDESTSQHDTKLYLTLAGAKEHGQYLDRYAYNEEKGYFIFSVTLSPESLPELMADSEGCLRGPHPTFKIEDVVLSTGE